MSTEILIIDDNPDIRNILKDLISDGAKIEITFKIDGNRNTHS